MRDFQREEPDFSVRESCPSSLPTSLPRESRQIASVAFAISFIVLFSFAVQVVADLLISRLAPSLTERDWYTVVLSTLPMYAVSMPLSLFFYRLGRGTPPVQGRRITPLALCGILCVCFAMAFFGNLIGTAVSLILGLITGEVPQNDLQQLTLQSPLWANFLFCGILAPVMEELFYRKLVIDRIRRYGDLFAVLVSGLLFGLIHGNFYQFFYATAIGILFGYLYLYSGKIRYTVVLHIGVNMIGGVYASEVVRRLDPEALAADPLAYFMHAPVPVAMYLFQVVFTGLCTVIAPVVAVLLWRHIGFRKGEVRMTPSQMASVTLGNPAVWMLAAVILMIFLI